jgi:hypothetical protein
MADLAAGDFMAVEAKFVPGDDESHPEIAVAHGRGPVLADTGRYRSHGAPVFARQGQFDTEFMPVTMAHRPGVVIIHFTRNGTIVAMSFRPPPP